MRGGFKPHGSAVSYRVSWTDRARHTDCFNSNDAGLYRVSLATNVSSARRVSSGQKDHRDFSRRTSSIIRTSRELVSLATSSPDWRNAAPYFYHARPERGRNYSPRLFSHDRSM